MAHSHADASTAGALRTDLYQLTMACTYAEAGLAEREAVFHLGFRRNPFGGGFALSCGLAQAVEWLTRLAFTDADLTWLAGLRDARGGALLPRRFLDRLAGLRLRCDVDAVPEGTVVFPHEPLLRVQGPLLDCQLVETALLNDVNFQTLVATKAARVCYAAGDTIVAEFGLRRAQGPDGGLSASRAAWIGGCVSTSNLLAAARWGIPVAGTHAHSLVLAFGSDRAAFAACAATLPDSCVLLVDTYDSREGLRHAVAAGCALRDRGHRLAGVRLDSGDLLALAREARRLLDEAGLAQTGIVASGELDEHAIARLRREGAPISVWGVGTRLVTAFDEPALGGVYKLGAIRDATGAWRRTMKRTDSPDKATLPGILQVRRRVRGERFAGDILYDLEHPPDEEGEDLLVPVVRGGRPVGVLPSAAEARARAHRQLAAVPEGVRRLVGPADYEVRSVILQEDMP